MILRDLDGVIEEKSSVSVQTSSNLSNKKLPILYDSWSDFKKDVKKNAWNEEIELRSRAGIQILFINL